jgi:hypothetical protein
MLRVRIASRRGNVILGVLGGLYALAALAVLVLFVVDVGLALVALDFILQAGLVGAVVCGVWFVLNALTNLGIGWDRTAPR